MKVYKWIEKNGDLYDFLRLTKNFKKKFFTIRYYHATEDGPGCIQVAAVGISRLLVYVVRWSIACDIDKKIREQFVKDHGETGRFTYFPYGFVPKKETELRDFYPLRSEDVYISVFEYEGFIDAGDIIDDDGTNLSDAF